MSPLKSLHASEQERADCRPRTSALDSKARYPIEQVFSKIKALLRKAAERTIPGLWRRIRSLLRTITEEECINFFVAMQAMHQRDRNPL